MKAKVIYATLLLTLFTAVFSQTSNHVESKPDLHEEMMTVPLYENKITDYRVSQTIRHGVKWSSILSMPTAAVVLYNLRENISEGDFYVKTAIMLSSGTGAALGLLGGGIYGYVRGVQLNRKSGHRTQKYRFGHELIIESAPPHAENITSYSLTYQTLGNLSFAIPTEYRLGYASRIYNSANFFTYLNFTEYNAEVHKIYFDALFNSNRDIFQFHYGIGGGYSWGELKLEESFETVKKEQLSGVFLYPLAGMTMNMYDFMYFRMEGKYELSYFNSEISDYFDNPETGYFVLSFSFGTYLF
jgi:hypothetical protein